MARSIYRFGIFRIDLAARELRRGDDLVMVSPKVFDCIAYLLENRERAVGRDELIAAVWGRVDVADAQLNQLLRKVRRAVGDSAETQAVIRTVPRFGFRWIADIYDEHDGDRSTVTADSIDVAQTGAVPEVSAPSGAAMASADTGTRRPAVLAAAAALLAIIMLLGGYALHVGLRKEPAVAPIATAPVAPSQTRIAVLPVVVEAGDGDSAWIRFGLMDLIASRLREAAMRVVPSSDIVALTRDAVGGDAFVDKVRAATGGSDVIVGAAAHSGNAWVLRLEWRSADGSQHKVETRSSDAVVAARDAADHLLALIGKRPTGDTPPREASLPEIEQRVRAALLADDFADARRVLAAAPAALQTRPELQFEFAQIDLETGQTDSAGARFAQLLDAVPAESQPLLRARILIGLGRANRPDHPELAVQKLSEAIALLEDGSEPDYLGAAYNDRGVAESARGSYDSAAADYARARIAYTLADDTLGLARVDNNEATLNLRFNRPADALPLLERSITGFHRLGAIEKLIYPSINAISAHLAMLQAPLALATYESLKPDVERLDQTSIKNVLVYQGAKALAASGRLREANALLAHLAQEPDRQQEAIPLGLGLQARLDFEAGHFDAAVTSARRAVGALALPDHFSDERADAWLVLIRALLGLHDETAAANEIRKFSLWAAETKEPMVALRSGLAEAEQAWSEGRSDDAMRLHEKMLDLVRRSGTPEDLAEAAGSYGNALLNAGRLDAAAAVIGQLAKWEDQDYGCAVLQARLYRALGRHREWSAELQRIRALVGERPLPHALDVEWSEAPVATAGR